MITQVVSLGLTFLLAWHGRDQIWTPTFEGNQTRHFAARLRAVTLITIALMVWFDEDLGELKKHLWEGPNLTIDECQLLWGMRHFSRFIRDHRGSREGLERMCRNILSRLTCAEHAAALRTAWGG